MNALATSPLSAFGAALLGGAVVFFLLFRLGRGEVSGRLWLDALSIGAVMGALIGFVEAPLSLHSQAQAWSAAMNAFGFAGFPEEAAKFAGAYWLLRSHYRVRAPRDLLLASAAVGLGFALLENILYVEGAGASWGEVAFSRAGTSVPFHVFLALSAGCAMARTGNRVWLVLVWIGLALLHGAYDFSLLVLEGKSPFPQSLLWLPPKLGLSDSAALTTLLLGAVALTCLAALWSAWSATRAPLAPPRPPPSPSPDTWTEVFLYGRASGLVLGLALILLYLVLLVIQGAAYAMLGQGIAAPLALSHAAPALSAGAMLIAFPPRRSHPLSRAAVAGWLAVGAVCMALTGVAAWRWGAGPLRDLRVARDLAEGAQARADGKLERARKAFEAALELNPHSGPAHAGRAQVENAMMQFNDAVGDMDSALDEEPNNVGYLLMRIDILKNLHRERDALADVDRAIKLAPREAGLWSSRAEIDHELGIDADANRDIARAYQYGADNQNVLRVRGELFLDEGDFDQAEKALDDATAHDPTDVSVRFARGRLRYYRENFAGAVEDLTFVEQRDNDLYPSLWLFLARARLGLGVGEGFVRHIKGIEGRWPAPVGRRFLGEISAEAMRAAAANDDQRCEADFYEAAFDRPSTPAEQTLAAMRKVYAECPAGYVEREGAFAAIRKLEPTKAPTPAPTATPTETPSPAPPIKTEADEPLGFALVDSGVTSMGDAHWAFHPESGGELVATVSLREKTGHGSLRLAPGPDADNYRLTFATLAGERGPPLSLLGYKLGPFLIERFGKRTELRPGFFLYRVDEDNFAGEIPTSAFPQTLGRLAAADRLVVEYGAAGETRSTLIFEIRDNARKAIQAATGQFH